MRKGRPEGDVHCRRLQRPTSQAPPKGRAPQAPPKAGRRRRPRKPGAAGAPESRAPQAPPKGRAPQAPPRAGGRPIRRRGWQLGSARSVASSQCAQPATPSPNWAGMRRWCAGFERSECRSGWETPETRLKFPQKSTPGPLRTGGAPIPLSGVAGAARRVNGSEHRGLKPFCDSPPPNKRPSPDGSARGRHAHTAAGVVDPARGVFSANIDDGDHSEMSENRPHPGVGV